MMESGSSELFCAADVEFTRKEAISWLRSVDEVLVAVPSVELVLFESEDEELG